jgi:hypothetical protein
MKTSQNGFIAWIQDLFKDERGSTSIKPVIALLGSLFLCITMLLNSYTHEQFKPADNLVNAVMIITAIGMGADSLDKFSFKPKSADPAVNPEPTPQPEPES